MKKVAKILVVAIAITLCLTIAKRALTPLLMKNSNFGITSLEQNGTDILFIGSSMFRQGIDTYDWNASGKRAYQLTYNGLQPFAEYITLKKVLEKTDIELLVIDMYPYTVNDVPKTSDTRLFQDQSFTFIYDLFSQMHQYGDADYYDLFEMIVQSNNEMFFTWPASYPFINKRYYRGSKIGETPGATPEYLDSLEINYSTESKLNTIQEAAITNIISLCNEHDTKVVFIETPKYKRLYEDTPYPDIMGAYLDFLKDKNVKVIICDDTAAACHVSDNNAAIEIYEYDSSNAGLFADLIHISSDGRRAFTQRLLPLLSN